jgi:hypothetical protein
VARSTGSRRIGFPPGTRETPLEAEKLATSKISDKQVRKAALEFEREQK